MRKGTCYIVGAGELHPRDLKPAQGDLLLAADGGLQGLLRLGLRPHAVVGDMDSYPSRVRGFPVLRFPVRKDETDLHLALRLGLRYGFQRFLLYGAAGGEREDHFLAALQLMAGASARGLAIRLLAAGFTVHALTDGCLLLSTNPGDIISVFSATDVSRGVRLRGLDYQAEDFTLYNHTPLGVSNKAAGRAAIICVRKGTLLVWHQAG